MKTEVDTIKKPKASPDNVEKANKILGLGTLKKLVDAFMSSVNKSSKNGVKEAADALINKCKDVYENLVGIKISSTIQENNVAKFDDNYSQVLEDLAKSSDKKEKKLATYMSNAFPHWCLELAYKLQESNFYKRFYDNKNTEEDNGEDFKKEQKNKGSFHKLQKKWKNLFSGKARKHETFNKIKNLVLKYSEPWAIAWVNAAGDDDPISESSAIKAINLLCKQKDVSFITDLGSKDGFIFAESFNDIFGDNFKKNSGKIKKSLKSIIDRLVSISKKLDKEKYNDKDKNTISEKIQAYNEDAVFTEVMDEPGILSKVWGKLTAAASTVGGGIKTAGGKVVDGAKAVGSGIAKGAKLVGTGALKVATLPKNLISKKWRNKIYYKLKKIFTREEVTVKLIEEMGFDNIKENDIQSINKSLDGVLKSNNLDKKQKQEIINDNASSLKNTEKISKIIGKKEKENKDKNKK